MSLIAFLGYTRWRLWIMSVNFLGGGADGGGGRGSLVLGGDLGCW